VGLQFLSTDTQRNRIVHCCKLYNWRCLGYGGLGKISSAAKYRWANKKDEEEKQDKEEEN